MLPSTAARYPVAGTPGLTASDGVIPAILLHGSYAASTLYSRSTCPYKAFFIPSQTFVSHGPYQAPQRVAAPTGTEQHAQSAKRTSPSSCMTGEETESGFAPDSPVLQNTQDFPDENLRSMLSLSNQDVMLLTISEAFEGLQS